jgi:hypothetical protein
MRDFVAAACRLALGAHDSPVHSQTEKVETTP